ncbi:MAG TPA: RNA polymerase sigma factor [Thermoleophilaceae bacterium]|nr:RNA polymerase sigma factor [Thermoleophilaceae bacterium]
MDGDPRDDRELLAATAREPAAFGVFYRRNVPLIVAYFADRTQDPELAADLTAETFAAALHASRRYRPGPEPAAAWLFAIARSKLVDSYRRGQVEERSRRKLAMQPLRLDDSEIERVEELADAGREQLTRLLAELPQEQREAIEARVIDERDYADIAQELRCSEQVARKRVSRGLAHIRARLEENNS